MGQSAALHGAGRLNIVFAAADGLITDMSQCARRILFCLFFLSGFSSLVYQVVWTRMAFASFGIIMPVLSVVLSIFMLGLAVGSWLGGRQIAALVKQTGYSAAFFYGTAEFIIGLGAYIVPELFALSERVLLPAGEMNSVKYLVLSAAALGASIFPWCVCMGVTFPFMMAYVCERESANAESFSFLYLANVLGAMFGCISTALVLVEILGFRNTLSVAAAANFAIAFVSWCLARAQKNRSPADVSVLAAAAAPVPIAEPASRSMTKLILFSTGFISMSMEVVWSRAFAPALKTQVYSFALVVFTYLGATFAGSFVYRRNLRGKSVRSTGVLVAVLAVAALLPVLADDPRLIAENYWSAVMDMWSVVTLLASIIPFCGVLGYLTPKLIDEFCAGNPRRAGQAYAINVLGCILGPLAACYLLLPNLSERYALIVLALPFVAFWVPLWPSVPGFKRAALSVTMAVALVLALFFSRDFEWLLFSTGNHTIVRRDYAASVIACGDTRTNKALLVNGVGMTVLTPITKFIAHLPLAFHQGPAKSMLIICFGMGTTYRSALTWGVDTTAVELVPSVVQAFDFYHADAAQYVNDPRGHIIIDDGRRYLRRTDRKFDIIVVDPPPPIEAAGSSLLFSKEFYDLAIAHLQPHGIVQMWFPGGEMATARAVFRSMGESFPYVRGFSSVNNWGAHLLGSMDPLPDLTAGQLIARMPDRAVKDLIEWAGPTNAQTYMNIVLSREFSVFQSIGQDPTVVVTDDRPFNEYFFLRRSGKSPSVP